MKLKPVLFGVIVGAVVAASVTAWATIPDSNTGAVAVCSNNYGMIRVIDAQAGKKCKRTEKALTLGARGATGPAGPAGGQGLVVRDANGTAIGSYFGIGPAGNDAVVLGLDGHVRLVQTATGEFSSINNPAQFFTTTDCSGSAYSSDSRDEAWVVPIWDSIYFFVDGSGGFVERQISREAATRISFSAIRSQLWNPSPDDPSAETCTQKDFSNDYFSTWTANLLLTASWVLGVPPVGPLSVTPAD